MIATLDTATLKAALMQLAVEEPNFLQELLHTLPQKNGNTANGVSEPTPKYGIPDNELAGLIQHNFKRYDETLRKLA